MPLPLETFCEKMRFSPNPEIGFFYIYRDTSQAQKAAINLKHKKPLPNELNFTHYGNEALLIYDRFNHYGTDNSNYLKTHLTNIAKSLLCLLKYYNTDPSKINETSIDELIDAIAPATEKENSKALSAFAKMAKREVSLSPINDDGIKKFKTELKEIAKQTIVALPSKVEKNKIRAGLHKSLGTMRRLPNVPDILVAWKYATATEAKNAQNKYKRKERFPFSANGLDIKQHGKFLFLTTSDNLPESPTYRETLKEKVELFFELYATKQKVSKEQLIKATREADRDEENEFITAFSEFYQLNPDSIEKTKKPSPVASESKDDNMDDVLSSDDLSFVPTPPETQDKKRKHDGLDVDNQPQRSLEGIQTVGHPDLSEQKLPLEPPADYFPSESHQDPHPFESELGLPELGLVQIVSDALNNFGQFGQSNRKSSKSSESVRAEEVEMKHRKT